MGTLLSNYRRCLTKNPMQLCARQFYSSTQNVCTHHQAMSESIFIKSFGLYVHFEERMVCDKPMSSPSKCVWHVSKNTELYLSHSREWHAVRLCLCVSFCYAKYDTNTVRMCVRLSLSVSSIFVGVCVRFIQHNKCNSDTHFDIYPLNQFYCLNYL